MDARSPRSRGSPPSLARARAQDRDRARRPRIRETVRLLLREGEIPLSIRMSVPGTTWEEIARFHDRGEATTALRRLERGFDTLARQTPGEPPHPSMSISCLPPRSR